MYHVKVMVVDDRWTSVGSTNFDSRSFRLNDEANLNILDPVFAKGQPAVFKQDKAKSRRRDARDVEDGARWANASSAGRLAALLRARSS